MNIEQELKQQKPFSSDYERLGVNLMFTMNWLDDKLKNHFAQFGITNKQYNILRILKGANSPLSTQDIRGRMIDRSSDISRIVDRMISKNYVSKNTRSKDKRLVDICLTPTGNELLSKIGDAGKTIDKLFGHVTKEEAKVINDILDKLRSK